MANARMVQSVLRNLPATRRVATARNRRVRAVRWSLIGVAVFFLALFIFLPLAVVFSQALRKGDLASIGQAFASPTRCRRSA